MEVAVKKIAMFAMALFSFGILSANCAAPINLSVGNTTEAPQTVYLKYEYGSTHIGTNQIGTDDTVAYRARNDGGQWVDISQITINGIFRTDIGIDPCVPAGTWTYVIPFSCNYVACGCRNYDDITVPDHEADCIDTAEPTMLTSAQFDDKLRSESWYESPDYSSRDEATVVADDTVIPDEEAVVDNTMQSADTDTVVADEEKDSGGCSLVIL